MASVFYETTFCNLLSLLALPMHLGVGGRAVSRRHPRTISYEGEPVPLINSEVSFSS